MFRVSRLCGEDPSSVRCVLLLNLSLLLPTTLPVWKAKGCSEQPGRQSLNLLHMHLKDKRQGLRSFQGLQGTEKKQAGQTTTIIPCAEVSSSACLDREPTAQAQIFQGEKAGGELVLRPPARHLRGSTGSSSHSPPRSGQSQPQD